MKNTPDRVRSDSLTNNRVKDEKGIVRGNFVELDKIDSGMIIPYYVCRKCGRKADTRHEKPECHTCADWGGCNRDCTLSHLVCESCIVCSLIQNNYQKS